MTKLFVDIDITIILYQHITSSISISLCFPSFFLRSIALFTVLRCYYKSELQILLLFNWSEIWVQHCVLVARDTLIGDNFRRVCEIMLWYWWSWSGGVWKLLIHKYTCLFVADSLYWTSRSWTLPWIFLLNAIWRKIVFYSCSSRMLT